MKQYFMGIDIGTFESRGMLIDEQFQVAADASVPHTMDNPQPGWFEQDALKIWWGDFCKLSHKLLEKSGIIPQQIACVGASALGTDCLPVDEDCEPLRPAILYGIDARAAKEAGWLTAYYGEARVQELFGHPICSGDTATKILWLKNNEPEVYKKTYKFLTGSSFLAARLTGRYTIDQFLAKGSFRPLYRIDGSVNEEECNLYCRPDQIAQAVESTAVIGGVTRQAASETGLAEGTPVIAGTGDSAAEAISVGLVEPGTVFFQYGSSMYYYYCTDRMISSYTSPSGNGSLNGGKIFTVPGTYCLGDGTNAAGTLTRWVRDLFYSAEVRTQETGGKNAYAVMAQEAAQIPPGCDGLIMLPYIYGERSPLQDPRASGMLFGLKGSHGRAHINRAALEAIGYSTYQHLLLFQELEMSPNRIITAGGGTKNCTWMQIISDMSGMDIHIPEPFQCSSYGDAMLAAVGVGALDGFSGLRRALPEGTVLSPNQENHRFYKKRYPLFRDLYLDNRKKMYLFDARTVRKSELHMHPTCVLFDFDGVIADTEESNTRYLSEALAVFGITLTDQDKAHLVGRNGGSILNQLLSRSPTPISMEDLLKVRSQQGNTYENNPDLKATPGLHEFLDFLRQKEYRLGLVSSTSARLILAALNRLGLTSAFDTIICGDMVQVHKPNPACYIKAMELLSVRPEECVIIEDSPVGIRAGLDAGAMVIGYTGAGIKQDTSQAHYTADSFFACAKLPIFQRYPCSMSVLSNL